MNNKKVALSVGVAAALLSASACSGGSYEYDISGTVEQGQIDYDCPGSLSMGAVAFTIGKPGGSGFSRQSSSGTRSGTRSSSTSRSSSGSAKVARGSSSKPGSTRSRTRSTAPKYAGAKLSKKPSKPKLLHAIPAPKYKGKPRGCKVDDYELFIRSGGNLYEQDVRKVDYDKCLDRKNEAFPACTKN